MLRSIYFSSQTLYVNALHTHTHTHTHTHIYRYIKIDRYTHIYRVVEGERIYD